LLLLLKVSSFVFILLHHLILSFQLTALSKLLIPIRLFQPRSPLGTTPWYICSFQTGLLSDNKAIFPYNICEKFYFRIFQVYEPSSIITP
jgi:hypothetical protein